MKINIAFLLIGLVLTITSKILQFHYKSKIGDIIVIPAAISFVLAVLFSINKFTALLSRDDGLKEATQIAFWACIAVVSFQVMMILLMGHGKSYGLFLIIPFVISVVIFINKWITHVN